MRTLMIVVAVVVVAGTSVMAEQDELRIFAISGKSIEGNLGFATVNFLLRNAQGDNIWSFNGLRYRFGQGGFIDAFVGLTFPEGGDGTYALSPRLQLPLDRFYVWQDFEWYPETKDWYVGTVLSWRTDPAARPGQGLELGIEFEQFAPGSMEEVIRHGGPLIACGLSDSFSMSLAWHEKAERYGGDFFRLTGTFLFF